MGLFRFQHESQVTNSLPPVDRSVLRTFHRAFQRDDQLGDSLSPSYVNCLGLLPSASIDQISRLPVRVDSNTRCRPSGAQLGRSLRPSSRVSSTSWRLTMSIT